MKDKYVVFKGGIGDIIINCFNTDVYNRLLDSDVRFHLLFLSTSKTAKEIFEEHPNKSNFVIYDLFEWFAQERKSGLSIEQAEKNAKKILGFKRVENAQKNKDVPVFYANKSFPYKNYAVVHPFSFGTQKRWPRKITDEVVLDLSKRFNEVIVLGSSRACLQNGAWVCEDYDFKIKNGFIENKLKLNEAIKLVQGSSYFCGTDSCFANLAVRSGIESKIITNRHFFERHKDSTHYMLFYLKAENCIVDTF
jgi:hypothetical protein